MSQREIDAASKFNCSVRERAIFESGIKLATIYHQFVGTPVNSVSVEPLELAIEESIIAQPYVSDAEVYIDRTRFVSNGDRYSYISLTGDMIDAKVTIKIDDVFVVSEMRYDNELKYPLMFVSEIGED
ncbi:MAG: dihydroneopterin aldolase family protein [Methanomassiliicoccales archaeon]|uniref:dihydroneopterin aldolase family protein n=1 Tax=Candidatus Methanarcanum hacksteinii TaxID=2911857 RepID=UPI0026FC60B7|nr:dihydroneopterin aldolase family protein [Candidatus Methanomethylophilaceae archaeon]MCI6024547.1 dihydroneopterin aldolase family protein [Methanomassiliicoccales archaeon]MDY4580757.1 dihydroneopterin aldolase family protein [Candidatus Methanarcanum hacksteinii]MDD7478567.1 dihydroneopterin aldolase family protein [Methanomassiliicoccales archaeon]MDO5838203.1 dihydroneopterin aldolase family protein [Methanomassiliicoccales archaeon]